MNLILFSGGVESTALLTLANKDDLIVLIDSDYYPDRTFNPRYKEILNYFSFDVKVLQFNYNFSLRRNRPRQQAGFYLHLADIIIQDEPGIFEVWYGLHRDEPPDRVKEAFRMVNENWKLTHPFNPLVYPLKHLSKQEQWNLLPEDIKPLINNCIYNTNCGNCRKCLELSALRSLDGTR